MGGAVCLPIFQSATFEYGGGGDSEPLRYIRLNNTPNHEALGQKLASAAGGEAALVTASGMAAISAALMSVLRPGDHLLVQNELYGGTHQFIARDLAEWGVAADPVDGGRPETWEDKRRPETKAIFVETLTNPLLAVTDLPAVAEFARRNNLVSMVDNTFATPVNCRPLELGFDLSLHSATKYLNGHSDIVAGVVAGRAEPVARVLRTLNHLGGTLDPHACFLLHRGLKTLSLRVERQNANALALAEFLAGHPAVNRVWYPGLPDHPGHSRAKVLLSGFGGMLAFEVRGGLPAAEALLASLTLAYVAPSLGGVETLATRPAVTSHAGLTAEERRQAGISDGLIRISAGIEAAADLIADFETALAAVDAAGAGRP
jgi:cystathionine beta-lyase/cystathionine gamma-synthase